MCSFHFSWSSKVTLRWVTVFCGRNSALYSTRFAASPISFFLCFLPKTTKWVFLISNLSWLHLYQFRVDCACICSKHVDGFFLDHHFGCSVYRVVSSACMFMDPHLMACRRSFTNINGTKMDPCGTPNLRFCQHEVATYPLVPSTSTDPEPLLCIPSTPNSNYRSSSWRDQIKEKGSNNTLVIHTFPLVIYGLN